MAIMRFSAARFHDPGGHHTDEVLVVLGFLLILAVVLGAAFSRRFLVTGLVLGASVPVSETLVHFSVLRALTGPAHVCRGRRWLRTFLPWLVLR